MMLGGKYARSTRGNGEGVMTDDTSPHLSLWMSSQLSTSLFFRHLSWGEILMDRNKKKKK